MVAEVDRIKRRWEREDKTDIDAAIATLLSAPQGHKFLWWVLQVGKVAAQPFSPGAPDVTAFNCGELNVGNQIMLRLMEANPDGYTNMQKEMLNARAARDAELNAASDAAERAGAGEWEPPSGLADPGTGHDD